MINTFVLCLCAHKQCKQWAKCGYLSRAAAHWPMKIAIDRVYHTQITSRKLLEPDKKKNICEYAILLVRVSIVLWRVSYTYFVYRPEKKSMERSGRPPLSAQTPKLMQMTRFPVPTVLCRCLMVSGPFSLRAHSLP
jgi:hypothetical protein